MMINAASEWRRRDARQVGEQYALLPGVDAVMVGGSAARGHADSYSDVEVGVFWKVPPTDELRRKAMTHSGADLIYLYPYDAAEQVWSDDMMIGRAAPDQPKSGLLVEVAHYLSTTLEQTLHDVLVHHDPDPLKQNLIAGVMDGYPLHGHDRLQKWCSQAADYPHELALAVVRRHAQIDHFWRWRMYLQRGPNLPLYYQSIVKIHEKLLHILLGINRVYYFGFKWLDVVVDRLDVKPAGLLERLNQSYQLPPAEGANHVIDLVEDTYDLIAANLPEINVAWLRRVFRYQRPVWAQRPPIHTPAVPVED